MRDKIFNAVLNVVAFMAVALIFDLIGDAPTWGAAGMAWIIVQLWLIEDKIK